MEFKEIKLIKDWFIALIYYKESYMILLGKYKDIKLDVKTETDDIMFKYDYHIPITTNRTAQIIIPFLAHNNNIFTLVTLNNKEEFKTIISTLEVVL